MRYIHDGKLRNRTIDPPTVFVFDESATSGTDHWRWIDR